MSVYSFISVVISTLCVGIKTAHFTDSHDNKTLSDNLRMLLMFLRLVFG